MAFYGGFGHLFAFALVVCKSGANGWKMLEYILSGRGIDCSAYWAIYLGEVVHVTTLVAKQPCVEQV